VITEARESGKSGICRENGELRYGLITEILNSGISADNLIFEAPNKELQVYFIRKLGANVNFANIVPDDVISLETLRLGLRSDTLELFEDTVSYTALLRDTLP
jgi:phosphosulfolactate synthase